MFVIVWECAVKPEHVAEFERHYAGDRPWARLFREDPAFPRTVLLRDAKQAGRYVTTDYWSNQAAYAAFQERTRTRYLELDARCERFAEKETLLGHFEVAD